MQDTVYTETTVKGDSKRIDLVRQLARPAIVKGYERFSLDHRDYPAVI